jgi:hypothetical protein
LASPRFSEPSATDLLRESYNTSAKAMNAENPGVGCMNIRSRDWGNRLHNVDATRFQRANFVEESFAS